MRMVMSESKPEPDGEAGGEGDHPLSARAASVATEPSSRRQVDA